MLPFRRLINNLKRWRGLPPSVAVVLMLAAATNASAELGDVGFQVKFSEKEMILASPNDPGTIMFASWDTPAQRIADRNTPFIEVMNLADSTGNLTEFRLTIGDTDFNFSDDFYNAFTVLGNTTPGVSIQSTTSMNGDELIVNIGNGGLAPGELVRFRIDLDPDAGVAGMFPHPDFRLVLFDMNDVDGNGPTDNAVVTALFEDPLDNSMTATASATLLDFTVTGPQSQFFNQFIRPYSVMEGVDIFSVIGTTPNSVIPEPASAVMGVMGMLAVAGFVRRRSSRVAA